MGEVRWEKDKLLYRVERKKEGYVRVGVGGLGFENVREEGCRGWVW